MKNASLFNHAVTAARNTARTALHNAVAVRRGYVTSVDRGSAVADVNYIFAMLGILLPDVVLLPNARAAGSPPVEIATK